MNETNWKQQTLDKDLLNIYKKVVNHHMDKLTDADELLKAADAWEAATPLAVETLKKYKDNSLQNIDELNVVTSAVHKFCKSDVEQKYGLTLDQVLDKVINEVPGTISFSKEKE